MSKPVCCGNCFYHVVKAVIEPARFGSDGISLGLCCAPTPFWLPYPKENRHTQSNQGQSCASYREAGTDNP